MLRHAQQKPRKTIKERWREKFLRPEEGCWEWIAAIGNHGYGVFTISTKVHITAHRYAWEISNGKIPDGMHVCHKCDNRKCVRPSHLFLGTNVDNITDSVKKGRRKGIARPKWGPDHPQRINPDLVLRGSAHGMAKFNEDTVRLIRLRYACGESGNSLAREYGVPGVTIMRIVKRVSWKHVE